jgi:transcriptional regulator with XRE-family HTH domain
VLIKRHSGSPGQRLKAIREVLGITTRDVQDLSDTLSRARGNREHYISHSSLTGIENSGWTPSIYKLYTLSVIYQMSYVDIMLMFGIDLEEISKAQLAVKLPKTHLVTSRVYDSERLVEFPEKFDNAVRLEETNLVSRMVQTWGEVPISFIQHLSIREHLYGYIGLEDYTLYPLIRPGSFVQIDESDSKIRTHSWENEFERPIYFLELHDSYACGWCQLEDGMLSIVPHPFSQRPVRHLSHPKDVEVVGRVTGVAMPLVRPAARTLPAIEESSAG